MPILEPATRALCERCRRPLSVCYCAYTTPLATRTHVLLLQHPRERDVGVGTARMARLCLPAAQLRIGINFDDDPVVQAALSGGDAYLLYPGPEARDVETVPPGRPITLILVDGTWSQAHRLLRANPALLRLPQLRFTPERPSAYNPIRREPADHCMATIEALAHVLGYLEGDAQRFQALLRPFHAMVDMQIRYVQASSGSRHRLHQRNKKRTKRSLIPPTLHERSADILCVHGEANTWPRQSPTRRPAEIVHWLARRPSTGEQFEAIIAPRQPLAPTTPFHIQVGSDLLLAGESWSSFVERWRAFLRPNDLFVAWGHFPMDTLIAGGLSIEHPRYDARALASAVFKQRSGTVEDCLPRLGLGEPPACGQGRGGIRLAGLCAIIAQMLIADASEGITNSD